MAPSPIYDNIETAFNRADINKDGRLTREEAQLLPAVDTRFDEIDADHNRFISRDEFRRAVQQQ